MRDWVTIELVLATLLVTTFTCVGLLALRAATSPRQRFIRSAVVLGILLRLFLIPRICYSLFFAADITALQGERFCARAVGWGDDTCARVHLTGAGRFDVYRRCLGIRAGSPTEAYRNPCILFWSGSAVHRCCSFCGVVVVSQASSTRQFLSDTLTQQPHVKGRGVHRHGFLPIWQQARVGCRRLLRLPATLAETGRGRGRPGSLQVFVVT